MAGPLVILEFYHIPSCVSKLLLLRQTKFWTRGTIPASNCSGRREHSFLEYRVSTEETVMGEVT
jgi:hypothetical protein